LVSLLAVGRLRIGDHPSPAIRDLEVAHDEYAIVIVSKRPHRIEYCFSLGASDRGDVHARFGRDRGQGDSQGKSRPGEPRSPNGKPTARH
jgi:hypothetical protein